jgi:hypothetical protein
VFVVLIAGIELRISEAISPIPNHLALFDGESDKLESAAEFPLVSHLSPRAHRDANLRNPQFDRDGLPDGEFTGDHSADSALTEVGATARQVFGDSGAKQDHVQGHVNGMSRRIATLCLF